MSTIVTVSLELEEFRLVAAAKAGNKHAYGQLVRRHQLAVFDAAYLLTGSAEQAQTVTLQAFVQAWFALRRLPVTVPFGAWVLWLATSDARADAGARRPKTRRVREQAERAVALQHRLHTANPGAVLPDAPDMSAMALARIGGDSPRGRYAPVRGLAAVAAIVALAAVFVLPALRGASGRHAVPTARATSLTPLAGAEGFPLGRRIPLTEARHAAGFTALMPPTPSEAYLGRDVPGGRVSLFAGRVLITEFRGAVFPYILTLIGPGTHAELTWVNGRPGVYGSSVHARAPGDVLTWLQGPLTLRIEGASTLEQALALARTLR